MSPRFARAFAPSLLMLAALSPGHAEDPDVLFAKARSLPKAQREEARALLRQALEGHPDYDDVRIHLARMYAWDSRYDEARKELDHVLTRRPGNEEARDVAIDVAVWSDHPHEGLRLCAAGLELHPSARLLYRKARILKSLDDKPGAYASVEAALVLSPNDQDARLLRDDLKELMQRDKVSYTYSRDTFSQEFSPWEMHSLTLGHHFDGGTVLARMNRALRFGEWGDQMELDAYPHLFEGTYAYLNTGRATGSFFPSTTYGGQLYHNFKGGIEASLGFRYLDFSGSTVTFYTGTFGKYQGNAFYTLTLNFTPSAVGSSLSGSLAGRWYFDDADSWFNLSAGTGFSPDLVAWSSQVVKERAANLSASVQKRLRRTWIISGGASLSREEDLPYTYLRHWTFTVGLEKRF